MIPQPQTKSDGEDEYARNDVEEIYHTNMPRYTAIAITTSQNAIFVRILVYTRNRGCILGQSYILLSCDCDAFANNKKEETNGFFLT